MRIESGMEFGRIKDKTERMTNEKFKDTETIWKMNELEEE
jgi:hypothetical protein